MKKNNLLMAILASLTLTNFSVVCATDMGNAEKGTVVAAISSLEKSEDYDNKLRNALEKSMTDPEIQKHIKALAMKEINLDGVVSGEVKLAAMQTQLDVIKELRKLKGKEDKEDDSFLKAVAKKVKNSVKAHAIWWTANSILAGCALGAIYTVSTQIPLPLGWIAKDWTYSNGICSIRGCMVSDVMYWTSYFIVKYIMGVGIDNASPSVAH